MIDWNWASFLTGFASGAAVGIFYFVGLAMSVRLALRTARPTSLLLISSALRIATVLGFGWLAAQAGPAPLSGFALAFLIARMTAIALARPANGAA